MKPLTAGYVSEKPFTDCHVLSNTELMQKLMQLFNSGGHGAFPTAFKAAEAEVIFAELVRRLDRK
jgi:hypothetical protein